MNLTLHHKIPHVPLETIKTTGLLRHITYCDSLDCCAGYMLRPFTYPFACPFAKFETAQTFRPLQTDACRI